MVATYCNLWNLFFHVDMRTSLFFMFALKRVRYMLHSDGRVQLFSRLLNVSIHPSEEEEEDPKKKKSRKICAFLPPRGTRTIAGSATFVETARRRARGHGRYGFHQKKGAHRAGQTCRASVLYVLYLFMASRYRRLWDGPRLVDRILEVSR